ncbi:hypothetical protein NXZ75_07960 [Lysinibacillus sphaericus]|uniref:hypothetical protein n=1 Tax=Lysinibacillus sphaericus TaxID=1421 RepID=UPI0021622300|nr:hypothetical protein [Lysinibacillus sphaericus]MCS1382128.1 hypothetical protein [Lysinibacillus sphaericus]
MNVSEVSRFKKANSPSSQTDIGWDSVPFSIELTDGEQSPVYESQQKIANSLEEFLSKITEDPEYFQQD